MNRFFRFLSTVAVLCSFVLSAGALEKFDVATASVTRQNPEIARGVRFSGNLDERTAADLHRRGATQIAFPADNPDSVEMVRRNIITAGKYGIGSVLLFSSEPALTAFLAKLPHPYIENIRTFALLGGASREQAERCLETVRKCAPTGWFGYEPPAYQELTPLNDCRVVYLASGDLGEPLAFGKKYGVPLLALSAEGNPEELLKQIHFFERNLCSWFVDPAGKDLQETLETLRRPLLKGAVSFDARFEGLKEAFQAARKPGTLNFGFITDTHYQIRPPGAYGSNSADSMRNFARMARELGVDFIVNGGDMVDGNAPREVLFMEIKGAMEALESSGLPVLVAIGNHDDATYYCRDKDRTGSQAITNAEWRERVTRTALERGAVADGTHPDGNYFYLDFPAQKIRVIVLAQSDNPLRKKEDGTLTYFSINSVGLRQHQLQWLAQKALDFRARQDRGEWGVLLISHAGLGDNVINSKAALGILDAFLNGSAFQSEPTDGEWAQNVSCDFTDQGKMRILGSLHGHEHRDHVSHPLGRFVQIGFLPGLTYRNSRKYPPRALNTPDEESWTMISLDPKAGTISGFRFGAGNDFKYRLNQ